MRIDKRVISKRGVIVFEGQEPTGRELLEAHRRADMKTVYEIAIELTGREIELIKCEPERFNELATELLNRIIAG